MPDKQDCSYQGEALNISTAFKVYGAVITKKIQCKNILKFSKKFEIFFVKTSSHTPY